MPSLDPCIEALFLLGVYTSYTSYMVATRLEWNVGESSNTPSALPKRTECPQGKDCYGKMMLYEKSKYNSKISAS